MDVAIAQVKPDGRILDQDRHSLPITAAIAEQRRLASRPNMVGDAELCSLLARIDQAHRGGTLNTHPAGRWADAPTGRSIAVGKMKLRAVRDAYYTLYLGLPPYDADEPWTR